MGQLYPLMSITGHMRAVPNKDFLPGDDNTSKDDCGLLRIITFPVDGCNIHMVLVLSN